jgi:hypothetical protein
MAKTVMIIMLKRMTKALRIQTILTFLISLIMTVKEIKVIILDLQIIVQHDLLHQKVNQLVHHHQKILMILNRKLTMKEKELQKKLTGIK